MSEELQGLDQLQLDNEVLRQQVSFLSWEPSRTPKPLSPTGTLYFIVHRQALSFPFTSGGWSKLRTSYSLYASFSCQVEDLKNKNLLLRAQLRHHGVEVVIKNDSS